MKEKLSALMDGELDGQLADRTIKAITEEEELKQVWDAYHLIGDAMRDNSHVSVNVRQRVATRLAACQWHVGNAKFSVQSEILVGIFGFTADFQKAIRSNFGIF